MGGWLLALFGIGEGGARPRRGVRRAQQQPACPPPPSSSLRCLCRLRCCRDSAPQQRRASRPRLCSCSRARQRNRRPNGEQDSGDSLRRVFRRWSCRGVEPARLDAQRAEAPGEGAVSERRQRWRAWRCRCASRFWRALLHGRRRRAGAARGVVTCCSRCAARRARLGVSRRGRRQAGGGGGKKPREEADKRCPTRCSVLVQAGAARRRARIAGAAADARRGNNPVSIHDGARTHIGARSLFFSSRRVPTSRGPPSRTARTPEHTSSWRASACRFRRSCGGRQPETGRLTHRDGRSSSSGAPLRTARRR